MNDEKEIRAKLYAALAWAFVAGFVLGGLVVDTWAQAQPVRHVVVVLLDDVGIDKVDCYGNPDAWKTPTLDAMAAAGVRFTRAYANPTCSPTRAAALTGRYGSRTGIDTGVPTFDPAGNPNGAFLPADSEPWLPLRLAAGGARSYIVGKWHLSHVDDVDYHQDPIAKGFTRWRGHPSNFTDGQARSYYSWTKQIASASGWAEVSTTTYATVDSVLEGWLALQAAAGQKSLTWLAIQAPHEPWDELPPAGTYTLQGGTQTNAKRYEYMLEAVDTLLGQLRSFYAAQLPVDAAQTCWVVMGDNGTPNAVNDSAPPHQHKATVYDGGVHVPLIVAGAGVAQPGRVSEHLVHAVDLWATVQALLSVPVARPHDSVSFAPVLADPLASAARAAVYVRHAQPNGFGPKDWLEHGAYDAGWSLLRRQGAVAGPAVELFDLTADPDQSSNLWPPSTPAEEAAVAALQPVIDAGAAP